jgi:glucosylceramidase
VLASTGAAAPIAGTAFHCYGGDQTAAYESVHAAWPDLQIWQTECSGGTWQGSREQAFGQIARLVLDGWNHWANAELLWNLALDPDHGPHLGGCDTCRGVVTVDPTTGRWTPEADRDVLATFAWAGAAGSHVLEAAVDPASGLAATAVCDPRGRAASVVWNPGHATTTSIDFGRASVRVDLPAQSLTAVRASRPVRCDPRSPYARP